MLVFLNRFFSNRPYSRDDKRYTEKKNKAERARRKKEDTARLRNIVDVALAADPRIKRIKQEEKEAREAKRKNKSGTGGGLTKAQAEEEKRRAEEEAKVKEEAEKVCFVYSNYDAKVVTTFCFLPRRSLKQRRKRRRQPLPTLRKRHAVLREMLATRRPRKDCVGLESERYLIVLSPATCAPTSRRYIAPLSHSFTTASLEHCRHFQSTVRCVPILQSLYSEVSTAVYYIRHLTARGARWVMPEIEP